MKRSRDKRSGRVSEPVQVYLSGPERARLDRLARQLDTTKSDVLRQALEALEQQITNPADHPALQIIGLVDTATHAPVRYDVAREHDRFLADSEVASWKATRKGTRRAR